MEFGIGLARVHQLCLSNICCYLFSYFGFFLSARVGAKLLSVWIIVGQEPTVLAVDASRGCSDNFPVSLIVFLFFLPPRQTKILSQRPVKPKLTNQLIYLSSIHFPSSGL